VLKKASRNRDAADIAVDNPAIAMQQFTDGLRRVLAAPKIQAREKARRSKRKRR
jgi:hypothetical protein